MWKFLILVVLPILVKTEKSYLVLPEDEVLTSYKAARGRALLTPEQEEFLMELLAADDALIEAESRGIVDDILQAISGTGASNIRVNIIGGAANQQQQPNPLPISASISLPAGVPVYNNQPQYQQAQSAQQPQQQQQPVNIINPTITLVSTPNTQEKTLINSTDTTNSLVTSAVSSSSNSSTTNPAPMPLSDIAQNTQYQAPSSAYQQQSSGLPSSITCQGCSVAGGNAVPQQQQQQQMQGTGGNVTTIGGNNNHLFNTISQVIRNSNTRNVTGIVDESLRIATPAPIREFVTGILNVVYCNGIRRLLGRC